MIEVRQLRYFIAVAEERHFSRAAARLNMAQPPLSQQIRSLEAEVGAALFIRTTRKVELTGAGMLLLERGRRILEELETLENDVRLVSDGKKGVLRIGFTGSATYGLMPKIVRASGEKFPGFKLSIRGEMLTPQLVEELLEGRLDIAVLRPPVNSRDIEIAVVGRDRLILALPADSPLAGRTGLSLSDLAAEPFVGYTSDSTVARVVLEACRKSGFVPNTVQEAKETSTLLSLVAAGVGYALIPESARAFAIHGAVFRAMTNAPVVDIAVAWRAADSSRLLHEFVEFLKYVVKPSTVETDSALASDLISEAGL